MNQGLQNKDVVVFFLDDNYIEYKGRAAFIYGGYFFDGNLEDLYKVISTTKINRGLEEWMPVKWNFLGELASFYKAHWKINNFGKEWNNILSKSKDIRRELIQQVTPIKILFSVFTTNKKFSYVRSWMVENLFQRIGMNMQCSSLNIIMCDFEHEKSKARQILEEEYFKAYYTAEGYLSGPLKNRGAFPSLSYGSTYYNPFLQISDIIVGCMGQLVKNWLQNQNPDDFVKECFKILKPNFVRNQLNGEIFKYGIISHPETFNDFLIDKGLK